MSRIVKNYIYNTMYQILAIIVPLVTAPYLARVLGAEKLGIYGYVTSITSIFTTFGLIGLYSYGNRETAYNREDKSKLNGAFWEIMIIRIGLLIITLSVYIVIASRNLYSNYFYISLFWLIANFIDVSWFFVGLEKIKLAVIKNAFSKLITVVGIFIFVKSEADLWIYFLLISLSTILSNLSIYPQLKLYIKRPNFKELNISRHLKGSIHMFVPQAATVIYLQIDKIMIEALTGQISHVGYYLQAEKLVNIPLALVLGLNTVMMPRIASEFRKGNLKNINNLLLFAAEYSVMIALPMTIGIIVVSRGFIIWFLGSDFLPTSTVLTVLSPLIIINSLGGISSNQYFTASNQINILVKTNIVAAVANVALNIMFIPKYSYVGAAFASILSISISVIIQYYYMLIQIDMKNILFSIFKYFIISVIMGLTIYFFNLDSIFGIYTFLWQLLLGTSVYFILLLIVKDKVIKKIFSFMIYKGREEKDGEI